MIDGLSEIVARYKLHAENHGKATLDGDSELANLSYDEIVKCLQQIRQFGIEGDIALLSLTEDENQSVRCWAASHSLRFDKHKAKKVLKRLSKERGIIAFDAEMVLKEWKKGRLELP